MLFAPSVELAANGAHHEECVRCDNSFWYVQEGIHQNSEHPGDL